MGSEYGAVWLRTDDPDWVDPTGRLYSEVAPPPGDGGGGGGPVSGSAVDLLNSEVEAHAGAGWANSAITLQTSDVNALRNLIMSGSYVGQPIILRGGRHVTREMQLTKPVFIYGDHSWPNRPVLDAGGGKFGIDSNADRCVVANVHLVGQGGGWNVSGETQASVWLGYRHRGPSLYGDDWLVTHISSADNYGAVTFQPGSRIRHLYTERCQGKCLTSQVKNDVRGADMAHIYSVGCSWGYIQSDPPDQTQPSWVLNRYAGWDAGVMKAWECDNIYVSNLIAENVKGKAVWYDGCRNGYAENIAQIGTVAGGPAGCMVELTTGTTVKNFLYHHALTSDYPYGYPIRLSSSYNCTIDGGVVAGDGNRDTTGISIEYDAQTGRGAHAQYQAILEGRSVLCNMLDLFTEHGVALRDASWSSSYDPYRGLTLGIVTSSAGNVHRNRSDSGLGPAGDPPPAGVTFGSRTTQGTAFTVRAGTTWDWKIKTVTPEQMLST